MKIEVSNGEIVDKITILLIKKEKLKDTNKLKNVNKELESIFPCLKEMNIKVEDKYFQLLKNINLKLWDIEDRLRELEAKRKFDNEFIDLARKVYYTNDERFHIKNKINNITKSNFIEEKSYEEY